MMGRMNLGQGAHLSGQTIGQPTAQMNPGGGNVQRQVASGHHSVDPEFDNMRNIMTNRLISEIFSRNCNVSSYPDHVLGVAKRFEKVIYMENRTKAAYSSILNGEIRPYLQRIMTRIGQGQQRQQMPQQLTSSSYGTTIPIPDGVQSASGNIRAPYEMNNSGGNLMAVSMSNRYHHSSTNFPLHSTANNASLAMSTVSMQEGQVTHMIPTPGTSNQQSLYANFQYSSGAGYLNGKSNAMVQMQQQQGPFASENNCCPMQHDLRGYAGSGVHSDMLDNSPSCGLSESHMFGAMSLHKSNVQPINRTAVSEAFINSSPYGTSPSKPLQRQVNPPTKSAPAGADIAVCISFNATGFSASSTASNLDTSGINLLPKSRMDSVLITSQIAMQSLQTHPYIEVEGLDLQEKVSLEQLHQQENQLRLSQPHSQYVQNQRSFKIQQQNSQCYDCMFRGNLLTQCHISSDHAEKLLDQRNQLHSELMSSQINDHADLPNFQGHYTQTKYHSNYKKGQMSSSSQKPGIPAPHDLLPPQQQSNDGSNCLNCFLKETYTKPLQPHCKSKLEKNVYSFLNGKIQDRFCQRKVARDREHHPSLSGLHNAGCAVNSFDPGLSKLQTRGSEQVMEKNKHYDNQVRLLLLLIHAKSCPVPRGSCDPYCDHGRELVNHLMDCQIKDCSYRYCRKSKMVSNHYNNCINGHCPVCCKAKEMLRRSSEQAYKQSRPEPILVTQHNMNERIADRVHGDRMDNDQVAAETFDDQPPAAKRSKLQPVSPNATENVPVRKKYPGFMLQEAHSRQLDQNKKMVPDQEVDVGLDMRPRQVTLVSCSGSDEKIGAARNAVSLGVLNEMHCHVQQETFVADKEKSVTVVDIKKKTGSMDVTVSKTGKPKVKGVSLMELFTPEQIHEHINSLRQWIGQSKAKAEKNQVIGYSESENLCQLCKVEKLNFEPPPIYCSPCGARIKRNASYYTGSTAMARLYFCISCYNASLGNTIEVELIKVLKADLEKQRNNVKTEEGWVQCDKCECWQHQICALFNARRNDVGEAEYTCYKCYIEEFKRGLRMPLPESVVHGAKDLPRTLLSDHIEERLFKRLKEERQERANKLKTSLDKVPGADGLVVRIVSSVYKKLEVKPRFFKILQEDNYPAEFPYKSKAILLFQKIEGVEVCLFGMYVQEYGAECKFPNQRRVYLSYLDSVKYFRPDVETVSGEALRTYVYHEILIGYLEYCKQRGFTSCYIWACPPAKGEDYILYCHPEIQKTPKCDKLHEWYLSMLQKAIKENIVVELTNLYDHFFVTTKECKMKVSAARLPYFDGDYWPGAAEDMINQLQLEDSNGKLQKKGRVKKIITKRALEAVGHTDLRGNAPKEAMLMQKLGETIYPIKDDLIMVHLQYSCSHCCILMVSGRRWVCNECKKFYICDRCYEAEQRLEETERHPSTSRYSHILHPVEIVGVPEDTKDRDVMLENEFFDTRQAFLSFCQGNNYQFDTLRRAKHSTMMILYHLHNPTGPAFVATCNVCNHDIETGQGWHCEDCPDFDMCASCYQKHGGANHHHKLTNNPSYSERNGAWQKRVQQARAMLELAMHASSCHHPSCQYPNCRKLKELFHHGAHCKIRLSGGCARCARMWSIIRFHSQSCRQSDCAVPRCRDFKSYKRKLDQLSESRRRASVNERVKQ